MTHLSAARERELISAAQFYIEQQARRRLLSRLWGRRATDAECAAASVVFNEVDVDGDGRMEQAEIAAAIGLPTEALSLEVFEAFDEAGLGYLDFEGYARLTALSGGVGPGGPAPAREAPTEDGALDAVALSLELRALSGPVAAAGPKDQRVVAHNARAEKGSAALKYLIRANQGMVNQIARQLRPATAAYDLDDMLQDGNMGLMQAIVRFDPRSGCRLSTYSYQWIRGLIMTGLHRRLNHVNLPQVVAQDVHKLRKLLRESSRSFVSVDHEELLELARQLNWNEGRLNRIVDASQLDTTHCASLQAVVGGREGSEFTLGDTVTSPTKPPTMDFRMTLETALESRAERNARIVRLRFGLEDGVEHTYVEIAKIVGLSPQRVCNVVNQELRFLKDTRALRAFEDGLDEEEEA